MKTTLRITFGYVGRQYESENIRAERAITKLRTLGIDAYIEKDLFYKVVIQNSNGYIKSPNKILKCIEQYVPTRVAMDVVYDDV